MSQFLRPDELETHRRLAKRCYAKARSASGTARRYWFGLHRTHQRIVLGDPVGVSKRGSRYTVKIVINGDKIDLGEFSNINEAAATYAEARRYADSP